MRVFSIDPYSGRFLDRLRVIHSHGPTMERPIIPDSTSPPSRPDRQVEPDQAVEKPVGTPGRSTAIPPDRINGFACRPCATTLHIQGESRGAKKTHPGYRHCSYGSNDRGNITCFPVPEIRFHRGVCCTTVTLQRRREDPTKERWAPGRKSNGPIFEIERRSTCKARNA